MTEFLKESGDRFQKTIVFCVDQEHAARMRQALINENPDLVRRKPAATSCESPATITEGQDQLGNFIDPEAKYPGPRDHLPACSPLASMRRRAGSSSSTGQSAP